jgi:hypothetical protein
MSAPVMPLALSDKRNAITFASSRVVTHESKSASGISLRLAGVSIIEGRTALTRISFDLSSSANDSVSRATPDLAAA